MTSPVACSMDLLDDASYPALAHEVAQVRKPRLWGPMPPMPTNAKKASPPVMTPPALPPAPLLEQKSKAQPPVRALPSLPLLKGTVPPAMRPPPPLVEMTRKAERPPPPLVEMTRKAAPAVSPLSVEYMVAELNKPKVMAADAQMQQPASASSASVIDLTWKVVVFCVFLRFVLL